MEPPDWPIPGRGSRGARERTSMALGGRLEAEGEGGEEEFPRGLVT